VSNKLGKGGNEGSFVVWCWRDFGAILKIEWNICKICVVLGTWVVPLERNN